MNPEELVFNYLFIENTYNKKIPPVVNETNSQITIDLEIEFIGVMNVDQDASTVTFKATFRQWWWDPRTTWDPASF